MIETGSRVLISGELYQVIEIDGHDAICKNADGEEVRRDGRDLSVWRPDADDIEDPRET